MCLFFFYFVRKIFVLFLWVGCGFWLWHSLDFSIKFLKNIFRMNRYLVKCNLYMCTVIVPSTGNSTGKLETQWNAEHCNVLKSIVFKKKSVASTTWYPTTVLISVVDHVLAYKISIYLPSPDLIKMDHIISMHKQNFIKIHSLFLKIFRKIGTLILIKGHNSVEKFEKISCVSHNTAYTKFHQNPSKGIKWK